MSVRLGDFRQDDWAVGRSYLSMGSWQGDAATSFHVLKEQWNANARELNAALRAIGDALVVNTNNYRTTEDANRQSFTGMSSVLG